MLTIHRFPRLEPEPNRKEPKPNGSMFGSDITTKNLVIYDDIHVTFLDFVIDHTASMMNCQISS
jgi:hypothetical protein